MQNVGRVRWSDLEALDTDGVMEEAKDFGLMNGLAVSVLISGSRSIAGFARADREFEETEAQDLEGILARLHQATIDPLSKSDRQALTELSIKLTH